MNIIAEYDSTVADAPAGFKEAVQAAIDYYDQTILNPITVKIMFSYGSLQGSSLGADTLGESQSNGNYGSYETYATVVSQLAGAATSKADQVAVATLPATDPTNGGSFYVTDTQAKIFGLGSEALYTDPEEGFVALSSAVTFTYDPTNRVQTGDYDAISVLEHEISEVMGRTGDLGMSDEGGAYTPLDLYRYSGPGVRDLTAGPGYFSVDGQNMLFPYNNPLNGGDAADWDPNSIVGDSYGDGSAGLVGLISPTDLLEMGVIGFNVAAPAVDDFNDGPVSDFLIENTNGSVDVGEVNLSGDLSYSRIAGLGAEWKFVGNGDFLGDGDTDFLIENNNGWVDVGEDGVSGKATYTKVGSLGPEWSFVGTGDFLGSGLSDFLIQNTAGWIDVGQVANGVAGYTQVGNLGPQWRFVGTGEYSGDSLTDFLIQNTNGAIDYGEVTNGVATYVNVGNLGPAWKFVGEGDFLGDGVTDFLIENTNGAVDVGEIVDGNATYTRVAGLGPEWKFVGSGDYTGTGQDSFMIENTAGLLEFGTVQSGKAQYTFVTQMGAAWSFHS